MVPWLGLLADGLLIAGGWWLAGHGLRQTRMVDRVLATAILAFTWCVLGLELLGSVGLLKIIPVLLWSGGLGAAGLAARWYSPELPGTDTEDWRQPDPWRWEAVIALGLVLWTAASLGMQSLLLPVKVVSDAPIYHLYFAARWWKAGQLFLVPVPFGESAATYFPANGDLWFTWLMVTWGGDRLARVGQAPFLLLAAMAAWGIARKLGASRNASLVAVCCFLSSTPLLIFSFEANVDSIFVACYLIAVYFGLCALEENRGVSALVLGGLAAGLAMGTKTVGMVFIPPLLLLFLGVMGYRSGSRPEDAIREFHPARRPRLALGVLVWAERGVDRESTLPAEHRAPGHGPFSPAGMAGQRCSSAPITCLCGNWQALVDTLLAVFDARLLPFWMAALAGCWSIGFSRRTRRGPLGLGHVTPGNPERGPLVAVHPLPDATAVLLAGTRACRGSARPSARSRRLAGERRRPLSSRCTCLPLSPGRWRSGSRISPGISAASFPMSSRRRCVCFILWSDRGRGLWNGCPHPTCTCSWAQAAVPCS